MDISHLRKEPKSDWYLLSTGEMVDEKAIGKKAAVLIRKVRPSEIRDAGKKGGFNGKRAIPTQNADDQMKKLLHLAVKGWRNFEDGGAEFPFNAENLETLDAASVEFAKLWSDVALNGNEGESISREEALGN